MLEKARQHLVMMVTRRVVERCQVVIVFRVQPLLLLDPVRDLLHALLQQDDPTLLGQLSRKRWKKGVLAEPKMMS